MRRWLVLTGVGLASVVATLLNPYGYRLWLLAGRVMDDPYLLASIGELMPPDLHYGWGLPGTVAVLAVAALRPVSWRGAALTIPVLAGVGATFYGALPPPLQAALACLVIVVLALRSRVPGAPAHAIMGCFFAWQGIGHVRHLPLMALALMPLAAWGLEGWAGGWAATSSPEKIVMNSGE